MRPRPPSPRVHDRELAATTPAHPATSRAGPGKSTNSHGRRRDRHHPLLAGSAHAGLLVLPVAIIVSREAIRAVPPSIYESIVSGPRARHEGDVDEIVERALRQGALSDEIKDRLKSNAFGMSGGQQQRLCTARTMAVEPDVILMDEPCSALDAISTGAIEELMLELKRNSSIVIVKHNMQQAARVSDRRAHYNVDKLEAGKLVEFAPTEKNLHRARRQANRGVRHREVRLMAVGGMPDRRHFQQQLAELERHALGGLDLVLEQLDRVLETIEHQDVELAQLVVPTTTATWRSTRGFLSLLALQAPVAGDLRLVAALLHVIKHVERMGDQCVNIAKLIPLSGQSTATSSARSCRWASSRAPR